MEQLGQQEGRKTPSWLSSTLSRDVHFPMGKSRARWGGQEPDGAIVALCVHARCARQESPPPSIK